MALAHLRTDEPEEALHILEKEPVPLWDKGRIGWKMIYSRILEKNGSIQKSETLLETLATAQLSTAEREGIENLKKSMETPE
jgi:hypothetical protein